MIMTETKRKSVVVAGSRSIVDCFDDEVAQRIVWSFIDGAPFEIGEIVSGGANGVDTIAEEYAQEHGFPLHVMEVTDKEWEKWGSFAGPRRNAEMAKYADAVIVIRINDSAGSTNMIKEARRHVGDKNTFVVDVDIPE